MLSLDAFLASGVTALGLSLVFLWLFINEKIVPQGRLKATEQDRDDAKTAAKDSIAVAKIQTEANLKLADAVKQLSEEFKHFRRKRSSSS